MAIHNASDLLVYAKSNYDSNGNPSPAAQVTRILVRENSPVSFSDGYSVGTLRINNVTDGSGVVSDNIITGSITSNDGLTVLNQIGGRLTASHNYTAVGTIGTTDDGYRFRDYQNGSQGIVPTLEIADGPFVSIQEGAIIIQIITPGSSATFDPVAFSTSASFSVNRDLRDITNKDSGGWSESKPGLKSFEMSTESLQSINPDTPLDGSDFFDKLKTGTIVDLKFSDRIHNIIQTNLTQTGVDGFGASAGTQTNLQADPFGGYTASKFVTPASTSFKFLKYTLNSARLEGKNVNWSFYIKASGSTNSATMAVSNVSTSQSAIVTILEGDGSIAQAGVGSQYWNITGLSTSSWTRVSFQMNNLTTSVGTEVDKNTFRFVVYPNVYNSQDSDEIFTSSWQIEFSPESTDYQDPTDITHWQGNAIVSSLSFDAGVEDNLTCSATFTGTANLYPNGLGPEIIGDTGFDDASYWTINNSGSGAATVIENGYGKIITTGGITTIQKNLSLTPGDLYLLNYTVHTSTQGGIAIYDGWEQNPIIDLNIPSTVGNHSVLLKTGSASLIVKRSGTGGGATTIWLSSISLKKVL